MVKTYDEWKQAVVKELAKFVEISFYLSDAGKERMGAFDTLSDLANACETPDELLKWIESKKDLEQREIASLESGHAQPAIRALRKIVEQSKDGL